MNAIVSRIETHPLHLDGSKAPDLAIIVPAFKQPGFLIEALECVIRQRTGYQVRVIVVDDGCPFPETVQRAQAYAFAYPNAIVYLRRANGGLSAARNTGIEFALAAWPELKALYFLDADNRIGPLFVERAMKALEAADDDIGWVYPDIATFGFDHSHDTSGPYSLLFHLSEGHCEAGSLVRKGVLESGVRFDETMKLGFEDWDFWLQAASRGFRGQHLPNSGFQYRRRAESMLSTSERHRQEILAYMRKKHKSLFSAKNLLALEHEEMPRYCMISGGAAYSFSDPGKRGPASKSEDVWSGLLNLAYDRKRVPFWPFLLLCSESAFEVLAEAGLIPGLLCQLQAHLLEVNVAGIVFEFNQPEGRYRHEVLDEHQSRSKLREAPLLLVGSALLCDCITDETSNWITSIATTSPQPRVRLIRISLPRSTRHPHEYDRKAYELAGAIESLHLKYHHSPRTPQSWRTFGFRSRHNSDAILECQLKTGPVLPVTARNGGRNLGFILPLADFGGVEKVAFNYAAAARERGHSCHLFIFEANAIFIPREHRNTFKSITFVSDPFVTKSLQPSSGVNRVADEKYFGTAPSRWALQGGHSNALGMLVGMDAVIAMHSYEAHGLMGRLRHHGVRTFVGLHVADEHEAGYPTGHPLYMLPFEHSYDGVLVISEAMASWCVGHGVPRDKVIVIPNAPGYAAEPCDLGKTLERRQASASATLNILFLGRLDYQKGLGRLKEIVSGSLREKLPVSWRIVGKAIVHDGSRELAGLENMIESPAMSSAELDALYGWADVVVLPSLYEGVPLTVLEAQRFGCVVVATDVGAVPEVIRSGYDGVLVNGAVPDHQVVAEFLQAIRLLAGNPALVRKLSGNAAAVASRRNWSTSMETFFTAFESSLEAA